MKLIAEVEPTVTTVYSPQYAFKDNEIKAYLAYLLKLKDYFTREVATKQEMIDQRETEVTQTRSIQIQCEDFKNPL